MARANEGDPLAISATSWNRHEAVADWYHRTKAHRELGQQFPSQRQTGIILIKNSSSADRRRGEILKIGDLLCTGLTFEEYGQYQWFTAAIHDGTDAPFAVLLQPIPDGEIGQAQIAGVCPALVNVTQAGQNFARPSESGTDVLVGEAGLGSARILYPLTGTGELECMVDLSGGRFQAWGVFDEAAAVGETKTVSVHTHAGDTGENVEAICKTAFTTGDVASLVLMNNRIYAGCWVPV